MDNQSPQTRTPSLTPSLPLGVKIALGWVAFQVVGLQLLGFYYESQGRIGLPIWANLVLAVLQLIYFAPGLVGSVRRHPQELAIWLVNIFLGWTFIGWVVAIVWAATATTQTVAIQPLPTQPTGSFPQGHQVAAVSPTEQVAKALTDLQAMKDNGLITDDEYQVKRTKILDAL